jgi:hypothetical protein
MRQSFRMTKPAAMVAAVLASFLSGCGPVAPGAPYALAPELPYGACGDLAPLRMSLAADPAPSPQSDALLRDLGVRCLGASAPPSAHVISEEAPGGFGR